MNPPSAFSSTDPNYFDVRQIPCRIKHAQIFQRWSDLKVDDHFVLVNDHDPKPLYYQFAAQFPRAFFWEYLAAGPEEFQVKITKLAACVVSERPVPSCGERPPVSNVGYVQALDARGLEPPEPLIRILTALESLPAGVRLQARTDREPCHLFGEAEQRGFRHHSTPQADGSWITVLERA